MRACPVRGVSDGRVLFGWVWGHAVWQGRLSDELDSAVRDMATMVSIATSLVPQFRLADQAVAAGGGPVSDVNPADAESLCDTTLVVLHTLLSKRSYVRGHAFVEVVVRASMGSTWSSEWAAVCVCDACVCVSASRSAMFATHRTPRDVLGAGTWQTRLFGTLKELIGWIDGRLKGLTLDSPSLPAARTWASPRLSGAIDVILLGFDSAVSPPPEAVITTATSALGVLAFMSPLTRAIVLGVPAFSSLLSGTSRLLSMLPLTNQATALSAILQLLFLPAAPMVTLQAEEQHAICAACLKPYVAAVSGPAAVGAPQLYPHVRPFRCHTAVALMPIVAFV